MELRDLIVTPLLLIIVYIMAYYIRPLCTDITTRRYFFPALTFKIIGALALGFIYQFYYDGGDTFSYHTHGSRHIWQALIDSPLRGIKLLMGNDDQVGVYQYASRIYFYHDDQSYFLIRIAALLDLITFSSYSGTALLFALLSFIGMWLFFLTFYKQYPHLHFGLAIAAFFLPSVFFWGSGILKDTITISCLGVATYCFYLIFLKKKPTLSSIAFLLGSLFIIFNIKKFILQAYLPAVITWIVAFNFQYIKSIIIKSVLIPILTLLILVSSYFAALKIGEDDDRYSVDKLAKTARVTAYDIRYWSGRYAGSGYALGELDGTYESMIRLAPQAINVSLFRPYLWEVKNPLMLLSAFESLGLLVLTIYTILKKRGILFKALTNSNVIFCLLFSVSFAFAVGVSTFNFGTLVRYKIPLLPFYLVALILLLGYSNKDKKLSELESIE